VSHVGNVGRNCLRGPVQVNFDLGINRRIHLGEKASILFRVDVFDVLNHSNQANPVSDFAAVAATGGTVNPNTGVAASGGDFGRIISDSSNPRIAQLSIHLDF
jgi:hypothetical protein